jgi:hypothetical protein
MGFGPGFDVGFGEGFARSEAPAPVAYSGDYTVVYEIDPTGKTRWVDYIPVKLFDVPVEKIGRFDDNGGLAVVILESPVGSAWVNYIPVVFVADPNGGKWRHDDRGFLPVVEVE